MRKTAIISSDSKVEVLQKIAKLKAELKKDPLGAMFGVAKGCQLDNLAVELRLDHDVMFRACTLWYGNLRYADLTLRSSGHFMLKLLQNEHFYWHNINDALQFCGDNLLNDSEFARVVVGYQACALSRFSESIRDDETVAYAALERDLYSFVNASARLRNDEAFARRALFTPYSARADFDGKMIASVGEGLRDNESFMRACVQYRHGISIASQRLKNSDAFIEFAVKYDPMALGHASDRLKQRSDLQLWAAVTGFRLCNFPSGREKFQRQCAAIVRQSESGNTLTVHAFFHIYSHSGYGTNGTVSHGLLRFFDRRQKKPLSWWRLGFQACKEDGGDNDAPVSLNQDVVNHLLHFLSPGDMGRILKTTRLYPYQRIRSGEKRSQTPTMSSSAPACVVV